MFLDERFTHNVSTKTWNDLKPPKKPLKTTYNHLQPPKTTHNHLQPPQKISKTTYNHLKNIYSLSQTI